MEVKLKRTREKYWDWYFIYFLPTIRFTKKGLNGYATLWELNIIWLTFNLTISYEKYTKRNTTA